MGPGSLPVSERGVPTSTVFPLFFLLSRSKGGGGGAAYGEEGAEAGSEFGADAAVDQLEHGVHVGRIYVEGQLVHHLYGCLQSLPSRPAPPSVAESIAKILAEVGAFGAVHTNVLSHEGENHPRGRGKGRMITTSGVWGRGHSENFVEILLHSTRGRGGRWHWVTFMKKCAGFPRGEGREDAIGFTSWSFRQGRGEESAKRFPPTFIIPARFLGKANTSA